MILNGLSVNTHEERIVSNGHDSYSRVARALSRANCSEISILRDAMECFLDNCNDLIHHYGADENGLRYDHYVAWIWHGLLDEFFNEAFVDEKSGVISDKGYFKTISDDYQLNKDADHEVESN